MTRLPIVALLACVSVSTMSQAPSRARSDVPDIPALEAMTARLAPIDLDVDISALPESEKAVLVRLVDAAKVVDAIFLRQRWAGSQPMLLDLARDQTPLGQARLKYFLVNKGPWSALDHDTVFIPRAPTKPKSGGFYPADATKAEIDAWFNTLSGDARAAATGFFTTIRRSPVSDGRRSAFVAVPYSLEYQGELGQASALLREAAGLTTEPTLKRFLSARADAFLSNDYYDSDLAWMDLDSTVEPTIGPYEVYEDGWFKFKAAFEAYIAVRDATETQKLTRFAAELQKIEDSLPMDARYRNPRLGASAPIRVVNVLFSAGDGNHDVQTVAFNLPNDERIVTARGSKRVMLKNIQAAKFSVVLRPISRVVLSPSDQARVSFDAFFTHTVMHELMHGLGPHEIDVKGRSTTVRLELKETHSALEEAKADIAGLFALQWLVDKGVLDRAIESEMYATFLASAFRSIRFGVNEDHGLGTAVQLNYLLDRGAFLVRPDGTFGVDMAKIRQGVVALTHDLLTLQAEGNYTEARAMIEKLGVVRPEVQQMLDRLGSIPVDVEPRFTAADKLTNN